jgi:hypothetical protein
MGLVTMTGANFVTVDGTMTAADVTMNEPGACSTATSSLKVAPRSQSADANMTEPRCCHQVMTALGLGWLVSRSPAA